MFGRGEHCVACHFGASSGSRRNCNEWEGRMRERFGFSDHLEIIKQITGSGDQGCNGFCRVYCAPAAKADHEIRSALSSVLDSARYQVNSRFSADCIMCGCDAIAFQNFEQWSNTRGVVAGHDEGVCAELLRLKFAGAAWAKHDARRRRKLEAFTHQKRSSGNRFVNFTLMRGSAIIGATVSRHF